MWGRTPRLYGYKTLAIVRPRPTLCFPLLQAQAVMLLRLGPRVGARKDSLGLLQLLLQLLLQPLAQPLALAQAGVQAQQAEGGRAGS